MYLVEDVIKAQENEKEQNNLEMICTHRKLKILLRIYSRIRGIVNPFSLQNVFHQNCFVSIFMRLRLLYKF